MRRATPLLFVLAAAVLAGPARADDPSDERFRRAEIAERAVGDLARAEVLYREAAELAADPSHGAAARLRRASCLRRLGRVDEARAILDDLAANAPDDLRRAADVARAELGERVPTVAPAEASGETVRLGDLRRELDESREVLVNTYERAVTAESQHAELLARYKALEAEVARRTAAAETSPTTAEEALAQRVRVLAKQRENDARLASALLHQARLFHRQGRFAEARALLYDAEARDPSNHEVRALLATVSAPLGERETLFERAMETAALGREVRSARLAAEVESLVEDARRRQSRGDVAGSAAPAEDALARLDAWGDHVRDGARLRASLEGVFDELRRRGVSRVSAQAPAVPPGADWTAALTSLLEESGREVASGLLLRFHDTSDVAPRDALPPVPAPSGVRGWSAGPAETPFAPLLAQYLDAVGRETGGRAATLRVVGTTIVAHADAETQRRLATRLASLRLGASPMSEVRITAVRTSREAVAAALSRRGLASAEPGDGTVSAAVPPAEVDALLAALAPDRANILADGTWRAPTLRAFRVETRFGASSLAADVLPVAGAAPGAAVRTFARMRRGADVPLTAEAAAGSAFAAGGALLVGGLPDPDRADASFVLIVRVGVAPAAAAPDGANAPAPPIPAAGAAEFDLPAAAASAEDPAPLRMLVADAPMVSRREAILRRIGESVRDARVEIRGSRVVVEGPPSAAAAARAWMSALAASPAEVRFDVRVHEISSAVEGEIVARAPRLARPADRAFAWTVLRDGAERSGVDRLLAQSRSEVPAPSSAVAAAPTARTDWAKLVTSIVRGADGVAQAAEDGVIVSLRPFGRSGAGATDVDVAVRSRRAGRASGPSAWSADIATPLGRGDSLLVIGRASPFAAESADLPRLAVVIRVLE